MPFDPEYRSKYEGEIESAVNTEMVADLLHHTPSNTTISANFSRSLDRSLAVIADLTKENTSVMYEIGYARANGLVPFLFSRKPIGDRRLPVYLTEQNVLVADGDDLRAAIRTYLRGVLKRDAI